MNIQQRINTQAIKHNHHAFTLVEIIVVVVIIGVLAGVIAPRIFSQIGRSRAGVARSNAAALKQGVTTFTLNCRGVTSNDSLSSILWDEPGDVPEGSWDGPYVNSEDDLYDPWGGEFVLIVPGKKNVDFDIISYGADGEPGGEDENADIVE